MLTIDLTKPLTRLIFTLTEVTGDPSLEYVMRLYSDYSKKRYAFNLGTNASAYPKRYDEFTIDTADLQVLDQGIHQYTVTAGEQVVETGLANVISAQPQAYITITPDDAADDYISI